MKRLLLFVLLLAVGFLVLQWAIGGEEPAQAGGRDAPKPAAKPEAIAAAEPEATPAAAPQPVPQPAPAPQVPEAPAPQQPNPSGVHVTGRGQDIGVTLRGGMTIPRTRDVRDGNRILHVPIYELKFADSEPLEEGRQRLIGVIMQLFDRGEHAADLTAATALVELGRDAAGMATLRENKEVELRDAVLHTLPGARLGPLRLELAVVRMRVNDDEIELHTPTEQDPVLLVVEGERPGRLTGRGLQARLPKDTSGQLQRIDIELLHEPVLSTEGIEVRAEGRMHYVEETDRGNALVTVDDGVRLHLAPRGAAATADKAVTVRGDHLAGYLSRQRLPGASGNASRVAWRQVRVDGAPATAAARDLDLAAPQLLVVPGLGGQPYQLTAAGGEAKLVQRAKAGKGSTFAARRIHLLMPGADQGAIYRAYGFPAMALGDLQHLQIGICEGETTVTADGGLELHSQRGLWVLQPDPDNDDGIVRMVAHGEVRFAQDLGRRRMLAKGSDGFVLTRRYVRAAPDAQVRSVVETLELGDPTRASAQPFELQRGDMHLLGDGSCWMERRQPEQKDAPATMELRLRSATPSIHGSFGSAFDAVQQVEALDLTAVGNDITALRASGRQVVASHRQGGDEFTAKAPLVWLESQGVLRLDGVGDADAELSATFGSAGGEHVHLDGPLLRIHELDPRHVVLTGDRVGDRRPHASGQTDVAGQGRVDFDLESDWLQLLPFAVSPSAIDAYGNFLPRPFRFASGQHLRQPWLFARGALHLDSRGEQFGTVTANGEFLALARGSQSALLVGDPRSRTMANIERAEADGRVEKARGPQLRFWRDAGERIEVATTFPHEDVAYLPELELHQPPGSKAQLAHLWATCEGTIAMLPDAVVFGGPVRAHGLLPDGNEDPDGVHIAATHLDMTRNKNGEVTHIVADDGAALRWNQLSATARHVDIDTVPKILHVSDPDGVDLHMPGYSGRVREASINYQTYDVRLWTTSVRGTQETPSGNRP